MFVLSRHEVLGRRPSCSIHLDHPLVSRTHAEIDWTGSAWEIQDSTSACGVRVNGERLGRTPMILEDGSEIALGQVLLRFRGSGSPESGG